MLKRIPFPAGMDRRSTDYAAEGRWFDGDKVRFVAAVLQKIGGWTAFSDVMFLGICRGLVAWRSFDESVDSRYLGIGTTVKLYTYNQGLQTDITPVREEGTLDTDPFTTVLGSAVVTVEDSGHNLGEGDYINFDGATAVGGITIDGDYVVTGVIDNNFYQITHSSVATSAATGGGSAVDYIYYLNTGYADSAFAYGYGIGTYGSGTWGTPRETSAVSIAARTWSLAAWGQNLLAVHRRGDLYEWDPTVGGPALVVANAPTDNMGMFVTPEFHVVLYGSDGNLMRIAWSDQGDNTEWSPNATNQAGLFDLIGGNVLLSGLSLRSGVNLILSDTDVFTMQYLGSEPWFGFEKQGSGAGIIAPKAIVEYNGQAFWMGQTDFFYFDGFPRALPSDAIRDYVFQDFNEFQRDKIFAGVNKEFGEIWWFYCSAAADEIDRYVLFNTRDNSWAFGSLVRTAWVDRSVYLHPLAAGTDGKIYQHEDGTDAVDAAIDAFATSAPFDLLDGNLDMEINGIVPDIDDIRGDIEFTLLTRRYPNDTATAEGPYTADATTTRLDTRASGKLCALKIESNEVGGHFRIGTLRLDIEKSGKRR